MRSHNKCDDDGLDQLIHARHDFGGLENGKQVSA